MRKIMMVFVILTIILVPRLVFAHCPLCTAGAGALAILAAYLGLSSMIIGVLIGAFAITLSLWLKRWPVKKYFPCQRFIIGLLIFLGTVIPIAPLVVDYAPLYVPFWGEYGRTFAVNLYLAGLPSGVLAVLGSPYISKIIGRMRGKMFPYQGVVITFLLLIIISIIIEILS